MSKLGTIKSVFDIVKIGVDAAGVIADKVLAKQNQERDEKIRALERQVAELKKAKG